MRNLTLAVVATAIAFLMSSMASGVDAQNLPVSDVQSIQRVDGVVPERRCPVHEIVMQVDVVDIHYGLLGLTSSQDAPRELLVRYGAAKTSQFPETRHWVNGGCVVSRVTHAEVYFCKKCRLAEHEWLVANPGIRTAELVP